MPDVRLRDHDQGCQSTNQLVGTRQEHGALGGTGLLQSRQEWDARNRELGKALNSLIRSHLQRETGRALDIGCMDGELIDRYGEGLPLEWWGIDPDVHEEGITPSGAHLRSGIGHDLPFAAEFFDCVTLANVYEHIAPEYRVPTLSEIHRVLAPGGILVGQLPNPYFPIESHSRLPFLGCLPQTIQRTYWRLTPTGWDFEKAHFFSVTVHDLKRVAERVGLDAVIIHNFNYSPAAIPSKVRWAAKLHARLGILPWSWQFVFTKKKKATSEKTRIMGPVEQDQHP
jgi:SAM-dependent methyltransferase